MQREDIPTRISTVLDRPVRWATNVVGDYDGCERTLEVFNAGGPKEQREMLRKIRPLRAELESVAGGSLIVIFRARDVESEKAPE